MPFNLIGFLAGRAIAENAGVDRQRATQLAILPGALDLPLPIGLVTARAIAQREVATATPPGSSTPPAGTGQDDRITVPDVTGQMAAEAIKFLSDRGFVDVRAADVSSSSTDKGKVVGQSYAPNTVIAKDDPIVLFIGQGPPPVTVPSVLGQSFTVAASTLDKEGLKYELTDPEHDNLPKDHVIDQDPDPDEPAPADKTITLTLSLGPVENGEEGQVEVPAVISMRLDIAQEILKEKDLDVNEGERLHSDEVPKNHVLTQEPDPFTSVPKGTTVTLMVSDGPEASEDII